MYAFCEPTFLVCTLIAWHWLHQETPAPLQQESNRNIKGDFFKIGLLQGSVYKPLYLHFPANLSQYAAKSHQKGTHPQTQWAMSYFFVHHTMGVNPFSI
jgi:hypothetical protein